MLTLSVKKLDHEAKLPRKAGDFEAGIDISSNVEVELNSGDLKIVTTGVAVQVPEGYMLLLRDRSGLGAKGVTVFAGVIDCTYRGEVKVILYNHGKSTILLNKGDRICQGLLLPVPMVRVVEVAELDPSPRGDQGFGSTGK